MDNTDIINPEQQPANADQPAVPQEPATFSSGLQTVTEDTLLSSPTPIDRDPPPLQDVPPPGAELPEPAPVPLHPDPETDLAPAAVAVAETVETEPESTDPVPEPLLEPMPEFIDTALIPPMELTLEAAPLEEAEVEEVEEALLEVDPIPEESEISPLQSAADPNLMPSLLLAPEISSTEDEEELPLEEIEELPLEEIEQSEVELSLIHI